MPASTALLVSRDSSVIDAVRQALRSTAHLRLKVRADVETASALVPRGQVILVLAHLPACGDGAGVTLLLRTVAEARRPCVTLVLAERRNEAQASALFRAGAADFLRGAGRPAQARPPRRRPHAPPSAGACAG